MIRRWAFTAATVLGVSILGGCVAPNAGTVSKSAPSYTVGQASKRLAPVRKKVEPVAEYYCRRVLGKRRNCDFRIGVDPDTVAPPNAYLWVDQSGRPQIVLSAALIMQAHNDDELAFVMSHEAAHHIAGHIRRKQDDAIATAMVLGGLVQMSGGNAAQVDSAMKAGAEFGAQAFSRDYEIEADRLGTIIAHRSGFDPVRGAQNFRRLPDPGSARSSTHPPSELRIDVVRDTAKRL